MKVPDCITLTPRHEVWLSLLIFLSVAFVIGHAWVIGREADIAFNEADYSWGPK